MGFGRAAILLFRTVDPQSHTFVPAGATRPPTRQQIRSLSRFPPPSVVGFRRLFVTFSYFAELCDFVKVEPPSRPELDFEGPGPLQVYFFFLVPSSRNSSVLGGSWHGGSPLEILSGPGGPSFVSKMLIGTGTPLLPKRADPPGCLKTRLETVGKKP